MAIFNTVYGGKTMTQTYDFTVSDYWFSFVDTQGWYGRTDWQWFYHYSSPSSYSQWWALSFPSSAYKGTLKNIHLRIYYPNREHWIGLIEWNNYSNMVRYYKDVNVNAIWNSSTNTTIPAHTWEVELDFNFDWTSTITGSVWWDNFSLTSSAFSALYSARENKNMRIICDAWGTSAAAYIRKISITTE